MTDWSYSVYIIRPLGYNVKAWDFEREYRAIRNIDYKFDIFQESGDENDLS